VISANKEEIRSHCGSGRRNELKMRYILMPHFGRFGHTKGFTALHRAGGVQIRALSRLRARRCRTRSWSVRTYQRGCPGRCAHVRAGAGVPYALLDPESHGVGMGRLCLWESTRTRNSSMHAAVVDSLGLLVGGVTWLSALPLDPGAGACHNRARQPKDGYGARVGSRNGDRITMLTRIAGLV